MDDAVLKGLKEKEKELIAQLQAVPVFQQLENLRATISLFQNSSKITNLQPIEKKVEIPSEYDPETMTWRKRILYAVNENPNQYISFYVSSIKKLEVEHGGKPLGEDFLTKRIAVTLSNMKQEGIIGIKLEGKKGRYYIK